MIFDMKTDNTGAFIEFRARWVVYGNRQQPGIEFDESYAPVSAAQSVKIMYALATRYSWKLRQFDVIAAYLNAAIEGRKVYMQMPTDFGLQDNVCLLNQALYGLRQAGNLWWPEFKSILFSLAVSGFSSIQPVMVPLPGR